MVCRPLLYVPLHNGHEAVMGFGPSPSYLDPQRDLKPLDRDRKTSGAVADEAPLRPAALEAANCVAACA